MALHFLHLPKLQLFWNFFPSSNASLSKLSRDWTFLKFTWEILILRDSHLALCNLIAKHNSFIIDINYHCTPEGTCHSNLCVALDAASTLMSCVMVMGRSTSYNTLQVTVLSMKQSSTLGVKAAKLWNDLTLQFPKPCHIVSVTLFVFMLAIPEDEFS